ncbi:hypothetical protein DFH06DRAFT_1344237 [Mycena polygramma]|nr:hypothetical protein DFH06DRAFT_1344237 [Mycena polygramma]
MDIRDHLRHNILLSPAEKFAIGLFLDPQKPEIPDMTSAGKEICTELGSLIAPIRRLPVEVLLLIFMQPDIHDHLYTGSHSSLPNAAVNTVQPNTPHLAAVCTHWRSILLSTPTFWARINTSLTTGRRALSLLRLYLRRARGAPLSLVLRTGGTHALNPRIVRALTRASARWISLSVPTGASSATFVSALPTLRLPRLERLMLVGQAVPLPLSSALAPRLRHISLEFGPESTIADAPRLEGGQIEKLTATFVGSGADLCSQLLSLYPNLAHLTLRAACTQQMAAIPSIAPAPSVRTFTLRGDGMRASTVLQLLNCLSLPNLETLELVDVPNCGDTNVPSVGVPVPISPVVGTPPVFPPVPVVVAAPQPLPLPLPPALSSVLEHTQRSGCRIKTLILQRTPIGCDALKGLLEGLPHLERLEISDESSNSPSASMEVIEPKRESSGCTNGLSVCSEATAMAQIEYGKDECECKSNLDPVLAWLSAPLPPSPDESRVLPVPKLHTLILHDTKRVFSVGALFALLEARCTDANAEGLTAVDITLPWTRVSAARFAALPLPSPGGARITCLDERGVWVRVCEGRLGW